MKSDSEKDTQSHEEEHEEKGLERIKAGKVSLLSKLAILAGIVDVYVFKIRRGEQVDIQAFTTLSILALAVSSDVAINIIIDKFKK